MGLAQKGEDTATASISRGLDRRMTTAGGVQYVFSAKTNPLVIQQVDKFPES